MKDAQNILILLKCGDEAAFRELYIAYSPSIFSLGYKVLKNKEWAEEVVQETFLKLWIHREEVDTEKSIWPYLYVIGKRICFNKLRTLRYDQQAVKELYLNSVLMEEENKVSYNELNTLLRHSVEQMPERQRTIWKMSREEGFTHQQIADKLGLSAHTVKNHIVQALKFLRNGLEKSDYLYFWTLFSFFSIFH
ncbi:RNA polymerase sigma-70 factor [Parapusillimonas sp. SGNA-6]|uniref:RNA polymerase sigma factor n=1 Tax=Parapedobacter sp. SGR-10 TaxID=2710879 RepID=UPI0013D7FDFA|nr:RNA polymerase sigma-70 factor [Parapedobacter sp. SGR-10]NGF57141.1 RNA polymerase sigma-70 factor [Parapedobacter sp. SGR-10]NGM89980.1 RNA polymerase sigma-70 factor [Parapusillimonas sp. SGNA-6]